MPRSNRRALLFLACLMAALMSAPAFAGGPLLIFDAATQTPFAYPPGVVPVYTDLGDNGNLTNAESDALTASGYAEWTNVASSYFAAAVVGDNSAVPLPDITGANAGLVVGTNNGGGIHVMYDDDGSITSGFFGAPPGVLGIASPDFSDGTANLIESWALINGTAADPLDIGGASYAGVFTHEFGHSINLAHTQTNGAVGFFGDQDVPTGCPPAAYSGGLTFNEFETMYPFLDPSAGSVGIQQATVNVLDDIASISNVYPTGGWPNNTGSITGTVFDPTGVTQVTGVNVIARNLADPFEDAVSALSGDYTQGDLGPDGRFTLNGLTPGASYVLYIDGIVNGGFSTPPAIVSPEEYWNTNESADDNVDDVCVATAIVAVAGAPSTNDVIINGDPNALPLGDDDFVEVPLPFTFPFCGDDYNSVFIGSNGFVTFGAGDTDFSESVAEFLANEARIAPFWDDLSPNLGGSITAGPNGPDFEVVYNNVPEFGTNNANNATLTLRADGTFDIVYGQVDMADGLTGRSPGGGVGDPGETDLTVAAQPIGTGLSTVYESFSGADNDLDSASLAFDTCEEDQGGGPIPLNLSDDGFEEIPLGFDFNFCETVYTSVFVGSNGFLTFGSGDTDFSQSVGELLANEPRIAALWTDLSPNQAGTVTWEDLGGTVEITFSGVTEFLAGNSNNFKYTLRSDNTYSIEYGQVDATTALIGRSVGGGADDPGPTDISAAAQPIGTGLATVYEDFAGNQDVANSTQEWDPCVIVMANISVSPSGLSETLCVGQTRTQTLTITNTGDGPLDFVISDVNLNNKPSLGPGKAGNDSHFGVLLPRSYPQVAAREMPEHAEKIARETETEKHAEPKVHKAQGNQAHRVPLPHVFAINLLTEDFNAGFPAGWSAIDNEGNGVIWSVPQAGTGNHTGGTGDAAGANSDAFGAAAFDTELRTPTITGFGPDVVLSYTANYQNFAFFDFLDVDISTDGGSNWTTVLSWNEDHGGFFSPPGEQVVLALDPFIGAATEFILRWHWYDPNPGNDFDWYAQIDDVSVVSGDPVNPCPWLSIAPDNGTVPPFSSTDLTVTFDATALAGGVYDCEFRIDSNAENAPQVVVPVQLTVIEKLLLAMNDVEQSEGVDQLLRIPDLNTGVGELIGSLGDNFIETEALAVRPLQFPTKSGNPGNPGVSTPPVEEIYAVDNDRLLRLDQNTADGTVVGPIGFSDVDGIAFNPISGILYGVTYGNNEIISINPNTGAGTLVAEDVIVGRRLEDLAFHPNGDAYILASGPKIYKVDILTGEKLDRWEISGAQSLEGLLWSLDGYTLYSAADRVAGKDLVTIELSTTQETGTASFVSAQSSGFIDIEALAWLQPNSFDLLMGSYRPDQTPVDSEQPLPTRAQLHQNVPNPFNPSTQIRFDLAKPGHVTISVYDVSGRLVRTLLSAHREAGPHAVQWDGRTNSGVTAAAGVYQYIMKTKDVQQSHRMVLLK